MKTIYVCSKCGSANIQERSWFNPNTGENYGWDGTDDCYCLDCQELTTWSEVDVNENETLEQNAVRYVWSRLSDIDKAEIDLAIDKSWHNHTGILIEGDEIVNKICDFLEEYGQDNDLQEGWWLAYNDEEEWIFYMLDLCKK